MTYFTDADIEMHELAEAARDAANGVCSICDEALDPHHKKWSKPGADLIDKATADSILACYGPKHPDLPYHTRCMEDDNR